jgi:VWFA-related protein
MAAPSRAVAQQNPRSPLPNIQVTSRLVFLDVTVVDKKGRPVVSGLTRSDFQITEDQRPQKIFSFEAPEAHALASATNSDSQPPLNIFVLDLLNSDFSDFAYIRYEVRRFLESQPADLRSPAELMVVSNESLELVQPQTRDRDALLQALQHIPAVLPYKKMAVSFWAERFGQSIDALREIALENKGIPGRKNIIWIGHGGPGLYDTGFSFAADEKVQQYVHDTTNLMVDSRVSLFVIYPGLKVRIRVPSLSAMEAQVDLGDSDPFAGNINFGLFVNTTGGKLFYNRNDIDAEMRQSQRLGSHYYTLTYQPQGGVDNGRFRRIRVTLRNPDLRVITKIGYFAPEAHAPIDRWQQSFQSLEEAAQSSLPFDALEISAVPTCRHPDSRTVELNVRLRSSDLHWQQDADGQSYATLVMLAESLSKDRTVLASRTFAHALVVPKTPEELTDKFVATRFTVSIPPKTKLLRIAALTRAGGRIGSVEVARSSMDAAPPTSTPQPHLAPGRENPDHR